MEGREEIIIIRVVAVAIHVVVVDTYQEKKMWKTAKRPHNN